jgi:hypothetical protein
VSLKFSDAAGQLDENQSRDFLCRRNVAPLFAARCGIDHVDVSAYQFGERIFSALPGEFPQQFGVGLHCSSFT